ncbi:MAG: cellulose-binding domain-containing protein, partial [Gemmataceae bacterium]|nr:cellulose-binding domain-containing protein [Gemmataceae bacterium]
MARLSSILSTAKQRVSSFLSYQGKRPPSHRRATLGVEMLETRLVPAGGVDTNPAVAFAVTNSWSSGLQGQLTITNRQTSAISDWKLDFDYGRNINDLWNAKIVSHQGTHYVIQSYDWNRTIAAG